MRTIRCLALFLLTFVIVGAVFAQDDVSSTPEATLEATPIAAFTPDLEISLHDLGYDAIAVRGGFGTSQIYLPVPITWQTGTDAAVSLRI